MRAGVISAHAAPKGLRVSNMIQQSVLDSLVAAAYILIISREPERCRGSGGYATMSAISRRHSNAALMLVHSEVTYDIMDSL